MSLRRFSSSLLFILLLAVLATTAAAQEAQVPVEELMLDNGMQLLLVQRPGTPSIAAGWVARVGSANESYGTTGMAHLFEHMMFKGTETIGTTDYEKERRIIEQLDGIRAEMEMEYEKLREAKRRGEIVGNIYTPEVETPRLKELRAAMHDLQAQQKEYIVSTEIDSIYTSLGASGMNAGTTEDFTMYFITVPPNKIEAWFWMESDRLLHPVFREFYSERDVVREERRARIESTPTGIIDEQFDSMFWSSTTYQHPVIGWPSDVESIRRAEAERFFNTYYAPNNLTAAIVGDFDRDQVVSLARTYFGRIPRGDNPPPPVVTELLPQAQERRMEAEAETNPSVKLRWHTVPFVHHDAAAFDVLSEILNGRTGRLYASLVEPEDSVAAGEPYAFAYPRKYAGLLELGAELADGHTHAELEAALLREVTTLQEQPVSARELEKVKNQVLANSFRRLQSNFFLVLQLLMYEGFGDWQHLNSSPAKLAAVTAEDIQRVATKYLTPEGQNVLWLHRTAGTTADPEIEALPAEMRPMVRQALDQIQATDSVQELTMLLTQMQGAIEQVPEPARPAISLIIERAQQRIDVLNAQEEN